jgi:hypothetical protein
MFRPPISPETRISWDAVLYNANVMSRSPNQGDLVGRKPLVTIFAWIVNVTRDELRPSGR